LLLSAPALTPAAAAAATGGTATGGTSGAPIEIVADQGIEWRQDTRTVIARGNARAVRGDLEVKAQVLSAEYREGRDGTTEVWRLEADGNVEISTPNEKIFADHSVFDNDRKLVVLTGSEPVRLQSGDTRVTAQDSMEYWTEIGKLVARGNATAQQRDRELRADTLIAHLSDDGGRTDDGGDGAGSSRLQRIEADSNVWVITPDEILRGDRGTYDVARGFATLTGSVRITQGQNQLNGCRGEIDLKARVSRLFACEGGGKDSNRVRGLIVPKSRNRD
jgi:lipopolysaccharide export system protein LptA